MVGKGAIKFFAIAFTLVCIFQLSFTFVSNHVEDQAREYAQGDKAKERSYLDSMMTENVFNLGVKDFTYQDCKERELNLGLDLKGGMHVTLEVSVVELIRAMANNSQDKTFNKALALAKERQAESQKDYVFLFGDAFEEIDPNAKLAAIFSTRELKDKISWETDNDEVLDVIKFEADQAIDRSFNILRTRIDKFGVSQPSIQRQEGTGRIIIELPGVDDPNRVRKLLQGTAKLEFWETWENAEIFDHLNKVNKVLAKKIALTDTTNETVDKDTTGSVEDFFSAEEKDKPENIASDTTSSDGLGLLSDIGEDQEESQSSILQQLAGDTTGSDTAGGAQTFENYAAENPLFAIMSPAIYQDDNGVSRYQEGPIVGYVLGRDTAKVNRYLAMDELRSVLPKNVKFIWAAKPVGDEKPVYPLIAVKITSREGGATLVGDVVTDSRQDFTYESGRPEISMNMNGEGARVWKRMTAENIGKSVAIVLDNLVYSWPTVQSEIPNGRTSITGNFTINEAKDLANILKAGKLPAPSRIVEEAIVGPSLGQESVDMGLRSLIAGLILVLLFMILYYSVGGVVADIALMVNVFFIIGVLASLGAALTLPGIAGIVLTIGMSVDANVLIFERIREEITAGKGMRLAVIDGYKKAYSSIIDANVTTLLTGIILYSFGSGPIKGFATVLIIGILSSLFSAIFITRLIFEWQIAREKPIKFSTKLTAGLFKNLNFAFIPKRRIAYIISSLIILAGIGSLMVKGLNYGVDFKGGRSYVVRFDESVNTVALRAELTESFSGSPTEVKTFGGDNQVKITTSHMIEDRSAMADSVVEDRLYQGLASMLGGISFDKFIDEFRMSSQKVGPTIADDIKVGALWSVIFSLIAIFVYILIRFRRWQFSLGALLAVFHDVLIVLSLFSIFYGLLPFSLEIDQAFIAAILTVIGYSINDTVVVFDRVREYLNVHHGADMNKVINDAINSTLSRTMITSITTLFVILILFIFGGEVIRGFSFALLIGILAGTYSSIFIATPVVVDFAKKSLNK